MVDVFIHDNFFTNFYFILAEDKFSVKHLRDLINNSYLTLAGSLISISRIESDE